MENQRGENGEVVSPNTRKQIILNVIKKYAKRYFIVAMNGMAMGLFASLIIGLIINQLARIPILDFLKLGELYMIKGVSATNAITGSAIGVGMAIALKNKNMVLVSAVAAGAIGYAGGPVGAFFAVLVGIELGSLVAGKTKVDIIITPLIVILSAYLITLIIATPIENFMGIISDGIDYATKLNPFLMGIILAVSMGMILTSPISSAAICIALNLGSIAAGAACVGCATNMVGFAICSYRKNGIGGLLSIGFGTSMLQMSNIIRKPIIWLPVIITSAILGPISTCVFEMVNTAAGAGMGTSGLVGQFGAIDAMSANGASIWTQIWQISLMHFIAPIILVFLINEIFKHFKLIKDEDYLLNREAI